MKIKNASLSIFTATLLVAANIAVIITIIVSSMTGLGYTDIMNGCMWSEMVEEEEHQNQHEQTQRIDPQKLEQFISKVINDLGATSNVALAFIGDKLGLYKAMAQAKDNSGSVTSQELASLTNTSERYIREWLAEQVCGGYITYDSKTSRHSLPKEHAIALTDESSPAYVAGAFQLVMSALKIEPKVTEAFRTGGGFDWSEHNLGFFEARP